MPEASESSEPSDRYEIRSKIGEGGIGAVYRAFDHTLKREVAIKRLLPQGDKPEEERYHAEEIVGEAGALSKLQHPNIVTVYDAGIDDDGGFVVMELIDGETVDKTLARGALAYDDFRSFVEQSLEGLIAAQDIDMLHRDLKPSNVMIRWLPSGKFQIKLLDFGLARVTQTPKLQTVRHGDSILGSIYFMAPEQFEREPLDGRTDLYSLGSLFYYMLAGTYPFEGDGAADVMVKKLEHDVVHLAQIRPDIPEPVCDWVMRMLAREREQRPDTAQAALEEFDAAALQAEAQLAKENRNPLLAPALAGGKAPAATPRVVTGPVASTTPGAPPLHTTSYYMQRPPAAAKSNVGVSIAAAAMVLLTCGLGGWILFGQKDKPKPNSTSITDDVEQNDEELDDAPIDDTPEPPEPKLQPAFLIEKGAWPDEQTTATIVALDAVWKYWDQGFIPSTEWRSDGFDDSQWLEGPAPLGYGESVGVHNTIIEFGDDEKKKHVTYLFRHSFNAPDAKDYEALWLRFRVDDGCIVYLNNSELCRIGMGDKQWPGPHQLAERTAENGRPEKMYHYFSVADLKRLRQGKNVIAIRVHQSARKSSDLGISFELVGSKAQ